MSESRQRSDGRVDTELLKLTNVNAFIEDAQVTRDVTLSVGEGETIGLVGRNGAGKTSTFRATMGLIDVRSGSITFKGEELTEIKAKEIPKRGIGYQPEDRKLFSGMSVERNFRMPIWASGDARGIEDEDAVVEDIFELFSELEGHRDVDVTSLSGGQAKMTAIGRAMALQPDLLLLDEPLEGLAPVIVEDLKSYIDEISSRGISVLIAESNIAHLPDIVDYMYVIERGEILKHGPPEEIEEDSEIQQLLAGSEAD